MSKPPPYEVRIEQLEAEMRTLRSVVEQGIGRLGNSEYPVQVRLFETGANTGETYPADPANVFPGRFQDCNFNPVEGLQTPVYSKRSNAVRARVLQIDDEEYLPPGAIVPVFQLAARAGTDGGRWYSNVLATKVRFRNDSAYEVPPYGCVRVTGYDSTNGFYTIDRPDATHFDSMYLINGRHAVDGATVVEGETIYSFGWGRFNHPAGLTIACGGAAPAEHECWGPQPDSFLLKQHAEGFLVTRAAGDGFLKALPYPILEAIGKCTEAVDKSDSGTVHIYQGVSGAEADSGFELSCLAKFSAITEDLWVGCSRRNGQWYMQPLECG